MLSHLTQVYLFFRPNNEEDVKIVAVDLQPMAPIRGVIQLQGDITKVTTIFASIGG